MRLSRTCSQRVGVNNTPSGRRGGVSRANETSYWVRSVGPDYGKQRRSSLNSHQHDTDVRLGELAIRMETRVHGSVAMDPVVGLNNRNPLDHRTLWERLARATPSEGELSIDANANAEILHVTANTGLCRASPHSQVPKEMEEELQSQLCHTLDHGSVIPLSDTVPGPVTGRHEWTWNAIEASGGLFAVVYQQSGVSRTPAAAFAAGMGTRGLLSWEAVWQSGPPPNTQWPKPPLWKTEATQGVPTGRWLISRFFPPLLPVGERAFWLVTFPRCVAWAWFLLARPSRPGPIAIATESPTVKRWYRAIIRSLESPGSAVEVEPGGWSLAAFDEETSVVGPCLAFGLWAPGAFKARHGSSAMVIVRAEEGRVRIDRPPNQSAWALHSELDDYVESVLAAAVATYWQEQGRVVG